MKNSVDQIDHKIRPVQVYHVRGRIDDLLIFAFHTLIEGVYHDLQIVLPAEPYKLRRQILKPG